MEITNIVLHKCKPLMHRAVTTLSATFTKSAQLLIGDNGSGKSTVLSELSPLPAVTTRFAKDGKKEISIAHAGHTYILISDFSDSRHTHSFIRDGQELNISGNAGIQTDLCHSEFGYTVTIQRMLDVHNTLTTLGKAARRELLFEMYPCDMTFILDMFKSVTQHIKALGNQQAMLLSMRADLVDQLMTNDAIERLKQREQDCRAHIGTLDKVIYILTNEIQQLTNKCAALPQTTSWNSADIRQQLVDIRSRQMRARQNNTTLFSDASIESAKHVLQVRRDTVHQTIITQTERAESLHTTIDEHNRLANVDVDAEIAKLKKEKTSLTDRIKDTTWSRSIPILPPDELRKFKEQTLPTLEVQLDYLDDLEIKFWPTHAVHNAERRIHQWEQHSALLLTKEEHLYHRIQQLQTTLKRRMSSAPPDTCKSQCALRKEFDSWVLTAKTELQTTTTEWADIKRTRTELQHKTERLKKTVAMVATAVPYIKQIEDCFRWYSHTKYVLNGRRLLSVLNQDIPGLRARLHQITHNSTLAHQQQQYQQELQLVEQQLKSMQADDSSRKSITTLAARHVIELDNTLAEIDRLRRSLDRITRLSATVDTLLIDRHTVATLEATHKTCTERSIMERTIAFDRELHDALQRDRARLDTELRETLTTLQQQLNLQSRLNDTVLPELEKVELMLRKATSIEPFLSPHNGIPHEYLCNFINAILGTMNELIRSVWGYGLEMLPIDINTPLTFTFPVRINDHDVVPDCSRCSKGEQEILNTAWIFALCKLLKLGRQFPIRFDEPDSGLSDGNRGRFLQLVGSLLAQGDIQQLFMVNHHYALFSAIKDAEILCLNPDNVILPPTYNEHVTLITH